MWILGLKGLSIPANSYILGSQTPLQRPLCGREAGENGKGSPLPVIPHALSFNFSIIAIFPMIWEPLRRRNHLRHESLTYRFLKLLIFGAHVTLSNKLAFRLKFQLFDSMVCSWCARRKVCDL